MLFERSMMDHANIAGSTERQRAAEASSTPFQVVILGASHAGIEVYYQLRRKRAGRALSVCIIDKQAQHGYIPLVHERLTKRPPWPWHSDSKLHTARSIARDPNAHFVQGEVTSIELDGPYRSVRLRSGAVIHARSLVIALGSQLSAPPTLIGREYLTEYKFDPELARARERFAEVRERPTQQLVVIGGGVSGVELAGELAYTLRQQPTAASPARVTLLQGAARLLPQLGAAGARKAQRALLEQGVEVRLETRVLQLDSSRLQLQRAGGATESLTYDMVFWAAGIRPNPLLATLGLALTERGYLSVSPELQCRSPGLSTQPDVYACGDAVRVVDESGEWPTLQRAIECLWQGKVVAQNLLRQRNGTALRRHTLWRDFPYGVSLGARSMIVLGPLAVQLGILAIVFRRFLMWAYFRRYERQVRVTRAAHALPAPAPASTEPSIDAR